MKDTWFLYLRAAESFPRPRPKGNFNGPDLQTRPKPLLVQKGHPIACVAIIPQQGTHQLNLHFGISAWNPADEFDRKHARVTAKGRAQSKAAGVIGCDPNTRFMTANRDVLRAIVSDPKIHIPGKESKRLSTQVVAAAQALLSFYEKAAMQNVPAGPDGIR